MIWTGTSSYRGHVPGDDRYGSISGYPAFRRTITFDDSPEVNTKTATVAVIYKEQLRGGTGGHADHDLHTRKLEAGDV